MNRRDVTKQKPAEVPWSDAEFWREQAKAESLNKEYYIGLLDKIAVQLNDQRVFVSDDGSIQDSVLRAKLPDLINQIREEKRKEHLLFGAGWMLADMCVDESNGILPRQKDFAGVSERLLHDMRDVS